MSREDLIRQYRIIRKPLGEEPVQLIPVLGAMQYNVPELRAAIEFCRTNEKAEMVGLRIGTTFYSVVVLYGEGIIDCCFAFED
jgi:hypothetical protein